jgi:hypothetical protein
MTSTRRGMSVVLNLIFYQIGWFACVLSAAHGVSWIGSLIALALTVLHLSRHPEPLNEAMLVLAAALLGAVWDSLLVAWGLISYRDGTLLPNTAPLWIVGLWALFATTLRSSLRWLTRNLAAAAGLGAVGGPLAYAAAGRLGALDLLRPQPALLSMACGWAVLLPALCLLARNLSGTGEPSRA